MNLHTKQKQTHRHRKQTYGYPGVGNGNPPNTLDWKIPWTEEPCRLQCMGSQRVGHD